MDANAASLYSRFTGLKGKAPSLQTWISVGGWSFTDRKHPSLSKTHCVDQALLIIDNSVAGPTRTAFSSLAGSPSNRQTFISGVIKFMDTYGFDGVDLDWEYPASDDRGGGDSDTANYILLVKDMKSAFGSKYGLSMTLPTSYWYLQHFDLAGIQPYVDWFNFMAYDLHGTFLLGNAMQ